MTRSTILTLVALTVPWASLARSLAQDIPPNIQRYIQRAEAQKQGSIDSLKDQIRDLQQQVKDAGRQGLDRRERRRRTSELKSKIKDLETQLDDLKKGNLPVPTIDPFSLGVGQIGRLYWGKSESYKVLSVVSDDRVLIVPYRTITKIDFDGLEARPSFVEERGEPLMLDGVSTAGMVDGGDYSPNGVFEVVGTERYTMVSGGVKTVFRLMPFDVGQVEQFVARPEVKQPTVGALNRLRRWTDASGEHHVVAKLVKVDGTDVVLEKRDGETITLPLERLRKSDQQWISANNKSPRDEN